MINPTLHCPCNAKFCEQAFRYDSPPKGETRFDLNGSKYERNYDRCTLCAHYFGRHDLNLDKLYESAYVSATYGGMDGMRKAFERIIKLPPERSDNTGRAECLQQYASKHFSQAGFKPRLLDVGSGLGVFPYVIHKAGWEVLALDPDPDAAKHIQNNAGIKSVAADFFDCKTGALGKFDVITFNKVLEHVEDPVTMLRHAKQFLDKNGFIYVELPDGEAAAQEGPGREEFFIEHHHVFSAASIVLLGQRAGYIIKDVERLREPSSKYTLRAFMVSQ